MIREGNIFDFNDDGKIDNQDINALSVATRQTDPNPDFDLNEDQQVNALNREAFFAQLGYLQSDLDLNGRVEFSDFLKLAQGFGQSGMREDGDVNGDGAIDFSDFLILSREFASEA